MENLDAEAGVLAVLDEIADVGEAVSLASGFSSMTAIVVSSMLAL